jgi:hypothetical protein
MKVTRLEKKIQLIMSCTLFAYGFKTLDLSAPTSNNVDYGLFILAMIVIAIASIVLDEYLND